MSQRSIIAMKGAPFTRKTEFATLIATSLSCPLLSVEDFLYFLGPNHVQLSPSPNNSQPTSPPNPQDLAFMIICQMAISHLSKGVADNVVLDSSLSSRTNLGVLIKLASLSPNTRLIIVECKPKNTYLWKMIFEKYLDRNPDELRHWYKAKTWDDVYDAFQDDDDDGYMVSKLVLDPLADYLYTTSIPLYNASEPSKFKPPLFMEAVEYMMTRQETREGPCVVVYDQWRQSQDRHSFVPYKENVINVVTESQKMENRKQWCLREGHHITNYSEESGLDEGEVNCMACGVEVKGAVYTCTNCLSALHKDCAESFDHNNKLLEKPCPSIVSPLYGLRTKFACASCKEDGKPFSENCVPCLFETNMKCGLMPMVIRHDCEQHFLSLVLLPRDAVQERHVCLACGSLVHFIFYSCKICNTYYHVNCLLEIPGRVKHEHGLHHHHMMVKFCSEEAEDYICEECQELRNPDQWFYSCQDCHYETHLGCILKKKLGAYSWTWNIPPEISVIIVVGVIPDPDVRT